ncbi:MAG: hypothetical protein KF826_12200 [Xanthobacteraceae bacterium]|nr:hypothetical protein [Xanthobacteraceae bacterium]
MSKRSPDNQFKGTANSAIYPAGPWPIELPKAMAAAFFGFQTISTFLAAVRRGEAPLPTATRGRRREPVWSRQSCEQFVAQRHALDVTPNENLKDLI